ncbi:D-glycero-beta-D-manno-heptose 1-phosphate adenylyltransferase [Candidatus Aerophobetes bacterium]|uniref:D-glycero-beta-D-manno-heptose 1-phosphate adenylyltransferase n=1 Tax=Aerophobetes bacterium TaxID=2030807 RepID=A0A2A4YFF3_UNCAE|nr:MAG: D-glycero-beta-D-manno-heptose 1-phosphate adenylyltransferase [Candidatus Aerophobetes bacterium]
MSVLWKAKSKEKLIDPSDIEKKVEAIKSSGRTLATLNGSFDLLHAGHLQILFEASQQADVLLVALNSDSSIQAYKDVRRPIVPLEYRIEMMCALEFVNFVTWFDETTPLKLLEKIKPDVHINGAEYGKDCLEANVVKQGGGKLHIVDVVPGLSTTKLIEKIKKICD